MRQPRPSLRRLRPAAVLVAGALVLTACAGDDPATASGDSASEPAMSEDAMADDPASEQAMSEGHDGMADEAMSADGSVPDEGDAPVGDAPLALTATRPDGSTFTLDDYAGQTLFVETFATWCSNCRRQLGDTNAAAAEAPDDVAFLILSVETSLDPAALEGYAAENGFDQVVFGVLDADSLAVLDGQFGRSVLNPPSTPKFTITPDGTISELTTGYESVDEILAQIA